MRKEVSILLLLRFLPQTQGISCSFSTVLDLLTRVIHITHFEVKSGGVWDIRTFSSPLDSCFCFLALAQHWTELKPVSVSSINQTWVSTTKTFVCVGKRATPGSVAVRWNSDDSEAQYKLSLAASTLLA